MDESKDHLQRRCPRLGGPVTFSYCRNYNVDLQPCWKALDCWWELFDVTEYFLAYLTEAEFDVIFRRRPKPKITSILELIQQAKQRTE